MLQLEIIFISFFLISLFSFGAGAYLLLLIAGYRLAVRMNSSVTENAWQEEWEKSQKRTVAADAQKGDIIQRAYIAYAERQTANFQKP